jgi:hypothetical protein
MLVTEPRLQRSFLHFSVPLCLRGEKDYFAALTSSTATVLPTGQLAATNDNP